MGSLTLPVFIFGSVIGWLVGALFHLIAGGKLIRLFFCILFSWIGFWGGNYISHRFGFAILNYGQVSYGTALIFSFIFAAAGYWISGENKSEDAE